MGETTPPPSLPQTAINEANMDFIHRATPHPQMVSPLQQRIAEEQQAKEDLIDDKIEGLDAEVLLNADTLEEGKPAILDLEEQEEPPPMLPPPLGNLFTPPPLHQFPPPLPQSRRQVPHPIPHLIQSPIPTARSNYSTSRP